MDVKERIIEVTISLIQQSNGNVSEITTRDIAKKADVGNGLINYHFQTKENLIAISVQRIIEQVVYEFRPNTQNKQDVLECMVDSTVQVFEFLFQNPAISRISILNDISNPSEQSNTIRSQQRICDVLGNDMDAHKTMFSFVLVSVMQMAFLTKQYGHLMCGYSMDTPESRAAFISNLVSMLLTGITPPVIEPVHANE